MKNDILSEPILLYILENNKVYLNTKIELIITKIKSYSNGEELKKYMSEVPEISKISSVFDNKYPIINEMNDLEMKIANTLIKYGYIKERTDKRIMLIKRKTENLESGYVNDEILH